MNIISALSTEQLKRAIGIKQEIERLQQELLSVAETGSAGSEWELSSRKMSAAAKAKNSAAARTRWAKVNGTSVAPKTPKKKDRRSSPAVKAKHAAAARARWAKVKAAGKTGL